MTGDSIPNLRIDGMQATGSSKGYGDPTLMQSITSSKALNSSEADLDLLL